MSPLLHSGQIQGRQQLTFPPLAEPRHFLCHPWTYVRQRRSKKTATTTFRKSRESGHEMKGKGGKTFESGDLVFAKVRGYPPWPARVINPTAKSGSKYQVFFFGEYSFSCRFCSVFFRAFCLELGAKFWLRT